MVWVLGGHRGDGRGIGRGVVAADTIGAMDERDPKLWAEGEETAALGPSAPARDDPEETVEMLVDSEAEADELAPRVVELDAADAADTLERLERDQSAEVVHHMDNESAAEALAHMEPVLAAGVMLDLIDRGDLGEAADLVGRMEPDDAADIVQGLPESQRAALLKRMHPRRAADIGKLVLYDPESAGGIMTTDIAVIRASMTIAQAIESIKRHRISEVQSTVFVVDDARALLGEISLRELLVADDHDPVGEHISTDLDTVGPEVDREEVARIFAKYDYINLPVVDGANRLLGMVTIDDVVDTIEAEATEDAMKQVGAGSAEAVYSSVGTKLRGRGPWLMLNLVTATGASSVLLGFQGLIGMIPIAAAIFPVIANMSGNSGFQSLAVTLRGLVLGEVHKERLKPLVARELAFGVTIGAIMGVTLALSMVLLGLVGGWVGLDMLEAMTLPLALVSGLALATALTVSCLIGTAIPLVLKRLGADPATASSIFLTMLTDVTSFGTFLGLVVLMRGWLVAPGAAGAG